MIRGWIEVEESQENPLAQHSGGSREHPKRIDDVSNHVRETFLLYQIKVIEVIQPKISVLVQTERIQKQDGNAEDRDEAQEALVTIAQLFARTRCFQTFGQIIFANEVETTRSIPS